MTCPTLYRNICGHLYRSPKAIKILGSTVRIQSSKDDFDAESSGWQLRLSTAGIDVVHPAKRQKKEMFCKTYLAPHISTVTKTSGLHYDCSTKILRIF